MGKTGCRFVPELSRLFQSYTTDCSALEGIALKAAMLMLILLLQNDQEDARMLMFKMLV